MSESDALRETSTVAPSEALPPRVPSLLAAAVAIESRTNLLFSFEKMALRDAVRSPAGARVLAFARRVRRDLSNLRPRDMIDLQSFIWVQGSDEYQD